MGPLFEGRQWGSGVQSPICDREVEQSQKERTGENASERAYLQEGEQAATVAKSKTTEGDDTTPEDGAGGVPPPFRHAKRADVRCQVEDCTAMTAEDSRARAVMATSVVSAEAVANTEAEAMSAEDVTSKAMRSSMKEPLPKAMAEVMVQEEHAPEEAMIPEKAEAPSTMEKMASLDPLMPARAIKHRILTARDAPPTASLQLWGRKVQGVDFDACDMSIHLSKLRGISLSLGVATLRDGGVSRAGEEFTAVCGFSAALGPFRWDRSI